MYGHVVSANGRELPVTADQHEILEALSDGADERVIVDDLEPTIEQLGAMPASLSS